ncbi:hypothetical protein SDJN03_18655, partial [Cucurbita argyrosperma subsp. sororia]
MKESKSYEPTLPTGVHGFASHRVTLLFSPFIQSLGLAASPPPEPKTIFPVRLNQELLNRGMKERSRPIVGEGKGRSSLTFGKGRSSETDSCRGQWGIEAKSLYLPCSISQGISYKELIESGLSGLVAKGSLMSGRSRSLRLSLTVKEN